MSIDEREAMAVLRAGRDALVPDGARARVMAKLGVSIPSLGGGGNGGTGGSGGHGMGGEGGAGTSASSAAGATSISAGAAPAAGLAGAWIPVSVVALVVATGAGIAAWRETRPDASHAFSQVTRPLDSHGGAGAASAAAETARAETTEAHEEIVESAAAGARAVAAQVCAAGPVRPAVSARPAPSSAAAALSNHTYTLEQERLMVEAAWKELGTGDAQAALSQLDQHARAFDHPQLAQEREALAIRALVRVGRTADARARAAAFAAAYPDSALLPAVQSAIR